MSALLRLVRVGRASGAAGLVLSGLSIASGCGRTVDLFGGGGAGGSGGGAGTKSSGSLSSGTQSSGTQSSGTQASGTQSSGTQASGTQSSGTQSSGTQSSGTANGSSSPSSSATGTPTCPGFGDMCTECESTTCADVWCGCRNNPQCLALFQCWNQCPPNDQGCIQTCMSAHSSGVSAALLVSDCAGKGCAGSCQGGQPQSPCTVCLLDNCASAMNTCFADAQCLPLYKCLAACPPQSLACQQGCYAAHGAGVPTLQLVIDCSNQQCPMVCK